MNILQLVHPFSYWLTVLPQFLVSKQYCNEHTWTYIFIYIIKYFSGLDPLPVEFLMKLMGQRSHIFILKNSISLPYKKLYPHSPLLVQEWQFFLTKGGCYESFEMLPINWANNIASYCLIFICLIITEMDHFSMSLLDIYIPSFINFLFVIFVNFLFG